MVDRFVEKTGAGHGRHADRFGHPTAEFGIVGHAEFRTVHHHVVGPLGFGIGEPGRVQIAQFGLERGKAGRKQALQQ